MEFSFAGVHEGLAAALGDREAIVDGRRRFTWNEFDRRSRRFAQFLVSQGLAPWAERESLGGHESGQHHVAICLYNSAEFLEALLGAARARLAPLNVNYRYKAAELTYLLNDATPDVLVFEGTFAPVIAEAVAGLDQPPLLVQVDKGEGEMLPGALSYENVLAAVDDDVELPVARGDDLYILYTGGTTGMPKGVLWRQADLFVTALGGRNFRGGKGEWTSVEELVEEAVDRPGPRLLPGPPFMHGTGQWTAFQALFAGGTVIIPESVRRFDAVDVLDTVEREHVEVLVIVGDAFARPIAEELERQPRALASLKAIISSGAAVNETTKAALARLAPSARLKDIVGSSESGPQADARAEDGRKVFVPRPGTVVVSADRSRPIGSHEPETGWLGSSGRVPLGYLGDPAKTAVTFPMIGGVRVSVPGDRARYTADGTIELLGRDSMTINTGGEKVFAEEVEAALCDHPGVADALVVGRPSERWGSEVVAVVERTDPKVDPAALLAHCTAILAGYKTPKEILFVVAVHRSAAGKPDYAWAQKIALRSGKGSACS